MIRGNNSALDAIAFLEAWFAVAKLTKTNKACEKFRKRETDQLKTTERRLRKVPTVSTTASGLPFSKEFSINDNKTPFPISTWSKGKIGSLLWVQTTFLKIPKEFSLISKFVSAIKLRIKKQLSQSPSFLVNRKWSGGNPSQLTFSELTKLNVPSSIVWNPNYFHKLL